MAVMAPVPTTIVDPATAGIKPRYENFIGGDWAPPTTGEYHDDLTPATGKPFSFNGVTFMRIENGKIVKQSDYYDGLGFQKQLGWIQ